jgi:hypothetical protein
LANTATSVLGNKQFDYVGRGYCDKGNEVLGRIGVRGSSWSASVPLDKCSAYALKIGGKSLTWKKRGHGKWGQECKVYKDYCLESSGSGHYASYSLKESRQMWRLQPTEQPTKFMINSIKGGCLFPMKGDVFSYVGMGSCKVDTGSTGAIFDVSVDCMSKATIKTASGRCLSLFNGAGPAGYLMAKKCDPKDAKQKWEVTGDL